MSWNEELFNEEPEEVQVIEEEIKEQEEPKKRTMFQRAVLQTANAPQIDEYYGEVWNRYTRCYETHLIKVYAPQPNLFDGLKPAGVGSQQPNK